MLRLLDMSVAVVFIALLLPAMLIIHAALALNNRSVTAGLQRSNFDKLPLLFQVLQGKLTMREWWRLLSADVWRK